MNILLKRNTKFDVYMEDVDSEEFINGYIRRLTYHEFYNNYEEIGG